MEAGLIFPHRQWSWGARADGGEPVG